MRALLIVDVQNDFLPGGSLAVPDGDKVVPVANRLMGRCDISVATQDWHPADHGSFAEHHPGMGPGEYVELGGLRQNLWPTHCVQETRGAEFAPLLDLRRIDHVVRKGMDPAVDSYSGFFDNARRHDTGLGDYLRQQAITAVYLVGLALDYCVKYTALDAVGLGFATYVVEDGVRGVELNPGDCDAARGEMRDAGVRMVPASQL